jgi:predicted enzyme related to lactoylglutathione lyase
MKQVIQRVDHVVILVKQENLRTYVERLNGLLGVTFDEPMVSASGTLVAFCLEAGLEIIAPTREEGAYWERLQRFGEGSVNIIFGVADLDQGMKRVLDNGGTLGHEARLNGDEPFLAKFSRFREVRVNAFDDAFGCVFGLSEIVPMNGD